MEPIVPSSQKSCQECREKPFLYQCPRCTFRSCSLVCCLAHKKRTDCNGKRDRTAFLPLGRMDDSTVNSDYFFLEDVCGQVESGKRLLQQVGAASDHANKNKRPRRTSTEEAQPPVPDHPIIQTATRDKDPASRLGVSVQSLATAGATKSQPQQSQQNMNPKWRHFQQQCSKRGTNLLLMPTGLERHKSNTSHCKHDVLHWTVEWRIHPSTHTSSSSNDDDVNNSSVRVVLSKMTEEAIVHQAIQALAPSSTDESTDWSHYRLLLKRLPCPSNQATFIDISADATLRTALADMTVIEYPTIEVVPAGRLDQFPRAIEEVVEEDARL